MIHRCLVVSKNQQRLAGGDENSAVSRMLFRCGYGFERFVATVKLRVGSCHLRVNEVIVRR